jgi:hypothetical protein
MSEEDHCKINLQPIFKTEGFRIKKKLLRWRKKGCQMVYFQTKNPNLGKFSIEDGIVYGHWVYLTAIWSI